MEIPNLGGFADPQNVSKKGTGSFQASYINWARTLHDIRETAPGWMPEMVQNIHGEEVHPCPDGSGYLMIRFVHESGAKTTSIPHAIMDHKMKPVPKGQIGARDVADSFVRGACKAAAALFGYAWEMWSKDDPMVRTAEEDKQIASERAEIKKGAIRQTIGQSEQTEDDVLAVGNDIVDQHSTPQSLMEDDPIAIQEPKETNWRDVICPFPKHKGKKLGEIASDDEDYLSYFAGKVDTIENTELADALIQFLKEKNNNGRQGFDRVG